MSWEPNLHCDHCKKEGNQMNHSPEWPKKEHICNECYASLNNGRPPLTLSDLNEIRKRRISSEQYYKEKGY